MLVVLVCVVCSVLVQCAKSKYAKLRRRVKYLHESEFVKGCVASHCVIAFACLNNEHNLSTFFRIWRCLNKRITWRKTMPANIRNSRLKLSNPMWIWSTEINCPPQHVSYENLNHYKRNGCDFLPNDDAANSQLRGIQFSLRKYSTRNEENK